MFPAFTIEAPRLSEARNTGDGTAVESGGKVYFDRVATDRGIIYRSSFDYFNGFTVRDFQMTRCGGLYRADGGAISNILLERIDSREAAYVEAQAASIFQFANGWIENVTLRDLRYNAAEPITNPGDIYAVITFAGKGAGTGGQGILIERFDFRNLTSDYDGFANRDGIAWEHGYVGLVIRDGYIRAAADAAIDGKGRDYSITNVTVESGNKAAKLWAPGVINSLRMINIEGVNIIVTPETETVGQSGQWLFKYLEARNSNPGVPLISIANHPCTVRVEAWDLSGLAPGTTVGKASEDALGSTLMMPGGVNYTWTNRNRRLQWTGSTIIEI